MDNKHTPSRVWPFVPVDIVRCSCGECFASPRDWTLHAIERAIMEQDMCLSAQPFPMSFTDPEIELDRRGAFSKILDEPGDDYAMWRKSVGADAKERFERRVLFGDDPTDTVSHDDMDFPK